MMAWSTLRQATAEDHARYLASAERFAKRHNIAWDEMGFPIADIEAYIEYLNAPSGGNCPDKAKYLRRLWRQCVRRALRHSTADGICYGYVGYSIR